MNSDNIRVEVVHAKDLMRQLRAGSLRVPRFQRPFVWNNERVLQLLDSIQKGYPIGSVFIWESTERCRTLDRVGPITVPNDRPAEPHPVGYLLDGHQRLATLLGALTATDEELDAYQEAHSDRRFRVVYNLGKGKFEHARSEQAVDLFPLRHLLDTRRFLAACEQIRTGADDPEQAAAWIHTAQDLVDIFQRCSIAVTRVLHTPMVDAIEAFTRLNQGGKPMTPEQIAFALTYREGSFNLSDRVDALCDGVLRRWRFDDINRTALLRVLLAALDEDIYGDADWTEVAARKELPETLDALEGALEQALAFLDGLGVSSQRALPYALQLVLATEFFRATAPGTGHPEWLEQWFWASSYSGAFMVGSSARFNEAVRAARTLGALPHDVDEVLDHGGERRLSQLERAVDRIQLDLDQPANPLPLYFHPRAARVRAFFLFLKSLGPRHPRTGAPLPALLDHGFSDAPRLLPDSTAARALANRFLLGHRYDGDPV